MADGQTKRGGCDMAMRGGDVFSMTRTQACYIAASNEILRTKNLDHLNKNAGEMRARAILLGCNGTRIPGELEQMVREIQDKAYETPEIALDPLTTHPRA
jgi:hypothetical protein